MQVITVQKHYLYDMELTLRSVRLFGGAVSYQIVTKNSGIILQGPQWLVLREYDLLVNGPAQPMPDAVEVEGCV